ncbi:MAG: hypothetical protein AAF228_00665 [Pseudomonadota bacterium]
MFLGILILIFLQAAGGLWLGQSILRVFEERGIILSNEILFVILFAVFVSIIIWSIGVLGAEILQGVTKPTKNTLVSALFVSAIVIALIKIPLFQQYIDPFRNEFVPGLFDIHLITAGSVLGYYLTK